MTQTVFIVDDEPEVRTALGLLIKSVGLNVEAYENANEFWNRFDGSKSGCILLDVRMPGMSGLDLQEKLNELHYHPPIIFISGHGEVPMAVQAMKSGAIDFIQKPFSDQQLIDRIQQALSMDEQQRGQVEEKEVIREKFFSLTPREREVMSGVVLGRLNKVIAYDLDVSTRTVEIHRSRVMEKMQVRSLSELVKQAGLIENDPDVDLTYPGE